MGRRVEVALYRMCATEKSHRYVRIVKSGRGWSPKSQPTGEPRAYYLRYLKNGHRTFESVGHDIQVALQEQKARQSSPSSEAPPGIISARKTLREATQEFLADKSEAWRHILGVFGDFYDWDKNPASFQRTDFKTVCDSRGEIGIEASHATELSEQPHNISG
jgi:hypothetical protein